MHFKSLAAESAAESLNQGVICRLAGPTKVPIKRVIHISPQVDVKPEQSFGNGDVSWTLLKKLAPPIPHAAAEDAAHWAWWQIAVERVAGAGFGGIADGSDRGLDVLRSVLGSIEIYSTGRARQIVQPDI